MNLEFFIARSTIVLFGLCVSGLVAYFATRWVRDTANRLQYVDTPNHRSSHTQPIPRLGGVAMILAFFAGLACFQILLAFNPKYAFIINLPNGWILLGALFIGLVGIWDDLKGVSAWGKLGVQTFCAFLVMIGGYRFSLGNLFGLEGTFILDLLTFAVTLIWIVGVINAVNLIDGLDGLAAGIAFIAVSFLTVVSAFNGYGSDLVFISVFLGALLGFLVFNRHPATIFMGDSGSLFLGFLLAAFALPATQGGPTGVAFFPVILILSVPLLDTSLSIIRRASAGKGLMTADREHVHHKLREKLGLSHRDAVRYLYGFSIFCGAIAVLLALPIPGIGDDLLLCTIWCGGVLFLVCRLGYVPKQVMESKVVTGLTRHPWAKKVGVVR